MRSGPVSGISVSQILDLDPAINLGESVLRPIPVMRPLLPARRALEMYLEQIDQTRRYSNFGPLVLRFEEHLACRFEAPAGGVITACNGTLALSAALAEAAVPGKTKCIVPGWAFVACIRAVELAGLEPVVADPDIDRWALDPGAASSLVAKCPDEIAVFRS